jgi:hypothetical protein
LSGGTVLDCARLRLARDHCGGNQTCLNRGYRGGEKSMRAPFRQGENHTEAGRSRYSRKDEARDATDLTNQEGAADQCCQLLEFVFPWVIGAVPLLG